MYLSNIFDLYLYTDLYLINPLTDESHLTATPDCRHSVHGKTANMGAPHLMAALGWMNRVIPK